MLMTIIADASWDPETGAGGYGYWSVSHADDDRAAGRSSRQRGTTTSLKLWL